MLGIALKRKHSVSKLGRFTPTSWSLRIVNLSRLDYLGPLFGENKILYYLVLSLILDYNLMLVDELYMHIIYNLILVELYIHIT